MKIKVGIFFGGPSREREISFAGGRTVYDNLNKTLFEPVPVFVDSHRNFILLEWPFIYKGTIRDFYPPVEFLPQSPNEFQVYLESLGQLHEDEMDALISRVGRRIKAEALPELMDVAFLALHGEYGEDGQIQRLLDDLYIPYTGSGIRASEIGMDKALQKELLPQKGFDAPKVFSIHREEWANAAPDDDKYFRRAADTMGFPLVVRPANQGSSIGVSIVDAPGDPDAFREAVNRAFFREIIPVNQWRANSKFEKVDYLRLLTDIRDGLGFPMTVTFGDQQALVFHPESLLSHLDALARKALPGSDEVFILESALDEKAVIVEEFIYGREFSCIVIRKEDGSAVALPPTEIVKGSEVFDYRSKYMPGMSRKETPIRLPDDQINAIRNECERLFHALGFGVYARIDGFITDEGRIFLNDPNTTSGMMPSSFFFHQAAEIGLNPSQFLTYILRTSLWERIAEHPEREAYRELMERLDNSIEDMKVESAQKRRIAVILGGYSFERHISVESGRNVFEKLSSSDKYEPFPVFLAGDEHDFDFYQLPINLLLKDNADDIRDKIRTWHPHPVIEAIKLQCAELTAKYASKGVVFEPQSLSLDDIQQRADGVFIAIHGRPGEDGQLQKALEARGIPYNGSDAQSSSITIDKYRTLQTLKRNGFKVTEQLLVSQSDYDADAEGFYRRIESMFSYPFIAKPVDDGCSSAVKVLNNRQQLEAFTRMMFRPIGQESQEARRVLRLKPKEEFPRKRQILFEALITEQNAARFLEITGGLLTRFRPDGTLEYEVFEPSEALAGGEVLSLEEKFLAGEGQNITPARFAPDLEGYQKIAGQVKSDLERAARILGVQGYARIDAFVRIFDDNSAETIIIEVNSLPGMTPATCIFHQAAINGYKPYDFIDRILNFAFLRQSMVKVAKVMPPDTDIQDALSELPTPTVEVEPEPEKTYFSPSASGSSAGNNIQKEGPAFEGSTGRVISYYLSELAQFLRSGIFLRNLAALTAFVLLSSGLLQGVLRIYTRHNESLQVHDYVGMPLDEAIRKARSRNFRVVVTDSIFKVDQPPNVVLDQTPRPLSRVKERRRIYLTVTKATPDMVSLPDMVGSYNYDQYARKLAWVNVRSKILERQFDAKQEENTILYFFYNGNKYTEQDIKNGLKIPMGATLEFVVTERLTGMVAVPDLVCKTYAEAVFIISSFNLNIGTIYGDGPDRDNYYIWKQEPAFAPGVTLTPGRQIDLYLTAEKPAACGGNAPPDGGE